MSKKAQLDADYKDANLASFWNFKFKEAMVAKAPFTKAWQMYWEAYNGEYFKDKSKPEYKSDLVSNYIFSIIETIRPIMLDNDPKFQAMPRHPEGMKYSTDLQEAFSYEWDRESMNPKLYRELITSLVTGTSIFFLPWDSQKKNVKAVPISPYNFFPDPLATCIEDSEYNIYASYRNAELLRRAFPGKAEKLVGGNINYGELVYDNNKDANVDNQILVLEVWTRDYETFEEDTEGNRKQKYPHGRVITLCPELGLVLSDKPNPYKDGEFPFEVMKDYEIPGKFWGEGEVAQLLSPQKYMNELNNAILDNAKATANMPWIVDKNSGIGYGKITSRPGLIIRKNPGSEVKRDQAPNMPAYVINAVEQYKSDMEQISGIFDTLKGNSETGVYTAQGILALQEAGQARVRLKVKLMEDFLGKLATKWYSRMKQFWDEERYVRIVRADGTYSFKQFKEDTFGQEYDIKIMAGSTMPVNRGAMLDLMIRLAQTQMPDGQTIVDREAVAEYLPSEVKSAVLSRMKDKATAMEQQIAELTQMAEQLGQQLQQVAQESNTADEQTDQILDQVTKTLEQVNKKILQLEEEHGRLEEEKKKEEERTKLRETSYNEGYSDAERLLVSETGTSSVGSGASSPMMGDIMGEGMAESATENLGEEVGGELPPDILEGIEQMSDDELQLLMSQNPELADLIR
jgi:hypothetical protein